VALARGGLSACITRKTAALAWRLTLISAHCAKRWLGRGVHRREMFSSKLCSYGPVAMCIPCDKRCGRRFMKWLYRGIMGGWNMAAAAQTKKVVSRRQTSWRAYKPWRDFLLAVKRRGVERLGK